MAMDTDDLEPRRPSLEPPDLELMSVFELEAYIAELEAEIARVRAVIESKRDHKSSAESVFRK